MDNLPQEDSGNIMRTIAQAYIGEGEARGVEKTAINMLKQNTDVKFVAAVTGLSIDELLKLKNKI